MSNKSQQKAANRANDLASQAQQRGIAEQSSIESKFQPSDAQDALLQELLSRQDLTPEQLFRSISPLASQYADITQQELTTPPQISFQDTLGPELQLAQDQIRNDANRRGILGSGLELEQQGRAGVDLAIKSATLRQQNALINQQLKQISEGNAANLVGGEQSMSDSARQQYLDYLQALRDQQLQGVRLGETAYQQGQAQRQAFDQASLDALNQQIQNSSNTVRQIGSGLGIAAELALAPATGGASLAAIPATAGAFQANPAPSLNTSSVPAYNPNQIQGIPFDPRFINRRAVGDLSYTNSLSQALAAQ